MVPACAIVTSFFRDPDPVADVDNSGRFSTAIARAFPYSG